MIVLSLSSNRHCPNRFHCIVNPGSGDYQPVGDAAPRTFFFVDFKNGDKAGAGYEGFPSSRHD